MTRDEASTICQHLRNALMHIELGLQETGNIIDREQRDSLQKTLRSASADIIAFALAPIFQIYPELQPQKLLEGLEIYNQDGRNDH